MKIKWLATVAGATYDQSNGIQRGQVSDVRDDIAELAIRRGHATPDWRTELPDENAKATGPLARRLAKLGWSA
jgi:hypothetical protein